MPSPLRILVAPDSFKGSLSAFDAADAIRRGALRARSDVEVDACPLSDGGEGMRIVLAEALGGTDHVAHVTGPIGDPVRARWSMLDDGCTAIIESAEGVGVGFLHASRRSAAQTTTYGVGELIREAVAAGARKILVGLGGTATTDGGAGMAQALGATFGGVSAPVKGGALSAIRSIDLEAVAERLAGVELIALADVDNPLTGPDGAARVYGPQKGATDAEVAMLDVGLRHLASLAGDPGESPGDGAAGGLGYGLRVFAGAGVSNGVDYVLRAVRFEERLRAADLVLTGEGRLDRQSARGKVVSGVARRCKAQNVPAVALVGAIGPGADSLRKLGLTAYFSLCDGPMDEDAAKRNAGPLLEVLAENIVRLRA